MEQINDIGFGILCFGDKKYFDGTVYKLNKLLNLGFKCYIATDNPDFFYSKYTPLLLTIIEYKREYKSYHDKILLVKEILKNQDVAIILDADMKCSFDFTPFKNLKNYNFKNGITYIENLSNKRIKKSTIGEMGVVLNNDWKMYSAFVNSKIGDFLDRETISEHFLVFKKFDYTEFFKLYEKLQIIKEYCDVLEDKNIIGAGEGITLSICSMSTGVPIQKDLDLYDKIKDLIIYE
jgi:hypothetical protein